MPDSPLVDHCRTELDLLAADPDSLLTPDQAHALVEVARAFTGHSGGSAPYGIAVLSDVLQRALSYEPLTPLTGAEGEWVHVVEEMAGQPDLWQNRRCGRVFKDSSGAYDIDAVVWTERRPGGGFTGWDSKRRVEFPYTPATRRVWHRLRWLDRLRARVAGSLVTA